MDWVRGIQTAFPEKRRLWKCFAIWAHSWEAPNTDLSKGIVHHLLSCKAPIEVRWKQTPEEMQTFPLSYAKPLQMKTAFKSFKKIKGAIHLCEECRTISLMVALLPHEGSQTGIEPSPGCSSPGPSIPEKRGVISPHPSPLPRNH